MIRPIVSKGLFLVSTPRGCSALVCVIETDDMVYVNEVTGFVGVEACGGVGFVALIVKVRTVIAFFGQ